MTDGSIQIEVYVKVQRLGPKRMFVNYLITTSYIKYTLIQSFRFIEFTVILKIISLSRFTFVRRAVSEFKIKNVLFLGSKCFNRQLAKTSRPGMGLATWVISGGVMANSLHPCNADRRREPLISYGFSHPEGVIRAPQSRTNSDPLGILVKPAPNY